MAIKIPLISSWLGSNAVKSTFVKAAGQLQPRVSGPDEALSELFEAVQKSHLYGDGKIFVDLVPRDRLRHIRQEYTMQKRDPEFDLREFVNRHFYQLHATDAPYHADPSLSITEHISSLWKPLTKQNHRTRGSLLALPYPYVVPGGRFQEQFYWDGYFIMLGLAADGHWKRIEGMLKNYTYMMRKFGYIPTANRSYFTSRSQPPFLSHMVRLLAGKKGRRILVEYLPYLLLEHRFWMKGHSKAAKQPMAAYARVVSMPDGSILSRYYDNKATPRPESLREDTSTAAGVSSRSSPELFLHLRAGAESGWDFSSRWFSDPADIRTIHTTDIVPVDLNCLLYQLEMTIVEAYTILQQSVLANQFRRHAHRRAAAIQKYCWNDEAQFFDDFDARAKQHTGRLTLAGVFPLYAGIATPEQAAAVAKHLEHDFLKEGGLITTLEYSSQQWDAPNGWAPLQYVSIHGLRAYGYHQLADTIKKRWVTTNVRIFEDRHKLIEKYNVVEPSGLGRGGEYPLQDGFGWTNGVLLSLLREDPATSTLQDIQ